ncbi:hypothetical protein Y032_0062g3310 [Ancylostoma ceylanicum]|uniref:SXP/RAL-2 family protein Ani s 5-like cation-binding domain-containing protein n=1 Tax=Ancylostoma ceylanicum TaxID=53326 RepID=A0A016U2G3_9BILA|nr:hypothetical protein Y032_0062g3310 [Ancylostoma ceylanicum]
MLLLGVIFTFVLSTSELDIHRNKGHFHHGHPKPEQLPSFLRNLSTEAQSEFFEIVRDRKTPRREIKARVEKWAEEQGVVVSRAAGLVTFLPQSTGATFITEIT